jgi:tetratricopeptide (TPR) repeat protein
MHSKREGPAAQAARLKVESELDNIREALGWAFDCEQHSDEALAIGQEISAYVAWVWHMSGYHREGIHWLSSAIGVREPAAGEPYLRCLLGLSAILAVQGRLEEARKHAQTAVGQARELGKPSLLVEALLATALVEMSIGNEDHADTLLSEAVPHARGVDDPKLIRRALRGQAFLAAQRGTLERALELMREARQIDKEIGDEVGGLVDANNEAATLTALGRHAESLLIARGAVCGIARLNFPELVVAFTETYAEALVGTGRAETAARLFGSAAAMRERTHIPIEPSWKDYTAEPLRACREALSDEDWDREYEAGQNMTVEDALEHAHRATPPDGASN